MPAETTDNSRRVARGRPANFLLSTALSAVGLLIRGSQVQILPGALICEDELVVIGAGSGTALGQRITRCRGSWAVEDHCHENTPFV